MSVQRQQATPLSASPFLVLAIVGVVWALLVRFLFLRSMRHHKTHYKLSESVWKLPVASGLQLSNGATGGGARDRLKLEVQPLALKTGSLSQFPWRQMLRSPSVM